MTNPADEARRWVSQGRADFAADRLDAAEAAFRRADALFPGTPAVLHALATIRAALGDHAAAEAHLRQARAGAPPHLLPQIEGLLGSILLARGVFREGFPLFDRWRDLPERRGQPGDILPMPLWDGGPLDGKTILVWGEEGLGDQIMYARFTPALQARAAKVVWAAPRPLVRLLRAGQDVEAVAVSEAASFPADCYVPSSQLAVRFMAELEAPPPPPYLRAPPPVVAAGRTVGVMVRGAPQNANDRHRSLPAAEAERLLALPGAVSLAPEDTGARDLYDTAAAIAGLDLVISVDTAVAHLAGALGKPLWILLPARSPDWRYGRPGGVSPWYPEARLFRQPAAGDWASVVDAVTAARGC